MGLGFPSIYGVSARVGATEKFGSAYQEKRGMTPTGKGEESWKEKDGATGSKASAENNSLDPLRGSRSKKR